MDRGAVFVDTWGWKATISFTDLMSMAIMDERAIHQTLTEDENLIQKIGQVRAVADVALQKCGTLCNPG